MLRRGPLSWGYPNYIMSYYVILAECQRIGVHDGLARVGHPNTHTSQPYQKAHIPHTIVEDWAGTKLAQTTQSLSIQHLPWHHLPFRPNRCQHYTPAKNRPTPAAACANE